MRLRCCNKNQECIDFFAQYGTSSNPTSGSFIPLNAIFRRGDEIHLEEETQIVLAPGYLYLIDYVFLATPEADGKGGINKDKICYAVERAPVRAYDLCAREDDADYG